MTTFELGRLIKNINLKIYGRSKGNLHRSQNWGDEKNVNASDIGIKKKTTRWNDVICVETGWTVKAYFKKIEGILLRHSI